MNLDRDRIFDVLRAAAQDLNVTQPAHTPFEPREETLLIADRDGPFRTTGGLAHHILTLVRTTSA